MIAGPIAAQCVSKALAEKVGTQFLGDDGAERTFSFNDLWRRFAVKSEVLRLSQFHVGSTYSRAEIASAGEVKPAGPLGPRGAGIAEFSNATIFLVTLDKQGREHAYEDRFEGTRFVWDSQNQHSHASKLIKDLEQQDIVPHLFVRVRQKVGSRTMPFVYCGRLLCVATAGNKPVSCLFDALDYVPDATGELAAVYAWAADNGTKLPDAAQRETQLKARVDQSGRTGQGVVIDPKRRKAIELRAMEVAIDHYEGLGFTVENTSMAKPYDLVCRLSEATRRVEVKGTTSNGVSVFLTINEVTSANNVDGEAYSTDLFILHSISTAEFAKSGAANGGIMRKIENWRPRPAALDPIAFKYTIDD